MLTHCPHCQSPLADSDVARQRCPRCSAPLDPPSAPASADSLQTVDDSSPPPTNPAKTMADQSQATIDLTAASADPMQTVDDDSQSPSAALPPGKSKTIVDLSQATIDLSASSGGPTQTLSASSATPRTPAASAKPQTIADLAQATIDLGSSSPSGGSAPSAPSASSPSDPGSQVTFDSTPGLSSAGSSGSASDSRPPLPRDVAGKKTNQYAMTMDSATSSGDVEQRLNALWGQRDRAENPGMTLRGVIPSEFQSGGSRASKSRSSGSSTGRMTLVIREREVRSDEPGHEAPPDYDVLTVLGEGGMGVVYAARQASIDREVALKMLHPQMNDNPTMRRKFLSEAAVTGELDHPNIVPIYDLGQNGSGALFYSMKKVQGTPWSKVLTSRSLQENLEILLKVADAIAFAHARGVIHRDLKPENIMLGEFGEVLVMDWGLAVATADHAETPNVETAHGVAGTPAYMAPEMAFGPMDAVGKHSDIYLLGAILFEIVTARPPHAGSSARECLMAAGRNEIRATSKRGELLDVAMKAMSTAPSDRHPTVQAFQEAIRQYQAHSESLTLCEKAQEILKQATQSGDYQDFARAIYGFEEAYSLWDGNQDARDGVSRAKLHYAGSALHKHDYDLGLSLTDEQDPRHAEIRQLLTEAKRERDARQHRLRRARRIMVGLLVVIFAAVSIGAVAVTFLKLEADKQAGIARENAQEADRQAELARANAAEAETQAKIARKNAQEAKDQAKIAQENAEEARRNAQTAEMQRQLAQENKDEAVRRQRQAEYEAYGALIGMAAAKIDENSFAQAQAALDACQPALRGREWGRLQYVVRQGRQRQLPVVGRPDCVAFNAAGTFVATGTREGLVQVWDVATQEVRQQLPPAGAHAAVTALAFAPHDDALLAVGGGEAGQPLRLWNWRAAEPARAVRNLTGHEAAVTRITFSRDGSRLLTASMDHTARLWNVEAGASTAVLRGHSWFVWSATFSPDEMQIATASEDGTVRLWDAQTGAERTTPGGDRVAFREHRGPVYAVAFVPQIVQLAGPRNRNATGIPSATEQWIVSAGYDKRVLLWRPADLIPFNYERLLLDKQVPRTPFKELLGHTAAVRDLSCSADGSRILSGSNDHTLRVWHARDLDAGFAILKAGTLDKELRGHDGPVQAAAFSPTNNQLVASASQDGAVRLWRLDQYHEERAIPGLTLRGHLDAVLAARYAPDGKSIVTASRDRTARKWRLADGLPEVTYREGHQYLASKALFDARRKRLLTAAVDGTVRAWDLETAAELFVLPGTGFRAAVALDPQGHWIATGSDEAPAAPGSRDRFGAILWDAQTGERRLELATRHRAAVSCVAFSPDGQWLYTGDDLGTGHLWETKTGAHRVRLDFHVAAITSAAFTADGRQLLTASADKLICPWDLRDPAAVKPLEDRLLKHSQPVNAMVLKPEGDLLVAGCEDGQLLLWDLRTREARPLRRAPRERVDEKIQINSVDLSQDARWLIAVDSQNDEAIVFDLGTQQERLVVRLRERDALGWSATFLPEASSDPTRESPRFVTVGGDEARMWNSQGTELASFSPHRPLAFADLSRPDGRQLVTAGWDHSARIWDASTGAPIITLNDHTAGPLKGHRGPVHCAVFSPGGKHVLTASDDGTLRLWDLAERRVAKVYSPGHGAVLRAVFTPDGERFVAAFRDGTLVSSALGEGESRVLSAHSRAVLDVAISADGRFIVSGSADGTARVWDAQSGQELSRLVGHADEVTAVALVVDPGDKFRVLTGSSDHTAKLWDVGTLAVEPGKAAAEARELLTLKGHSRGLTSVAFSPTDLSLLTAGRDGIAIVWPADRWIADAPRQE